MGGNQEGPALREATAEVRRCADAMSAQAARLQAAIATLGVEAALREGVDELCQHVQDVAGRVVFELALMEDELARRRAGHLPPLQRLIGLEASMMGALTPIADFAERLEEAAVADPARFAAYVRVVETAGAMLEALGRVQASFERIGR